MFEKLRETYQSLISRAKNLDTGASVVNVHANMDHHINPLWIYEGLHAQSLSFRATSNFFYNNF